MTTKTVAEPRSSQYGPARPDQLRLLFLRAVLRGPVEHTACEEAMQAAFDAAIGFDVCAMLNGLLPAHPDGHASIAAAAQATLTQKLCDGTMYGLAGAGYVYRALEFEIRKHPLWRNEAVAPVMEAVAPRTDREDDDCWKNRAAAIQCVRPELRAALEEELEKLRLRDGDAIGSEELADVEQALDAFLQRLAQACDRAPVLTDAKAPKAKASKAAPRQSLLRLDWRTNLALRIRELPEREQLLLDALRFAPQCPTVAELTTHLKIDTATLTVMLERLQVCVRTAYNQDATTNEAYGHARRLWEKNDGNPAHERAKHLYADTPYAESHAELLRAVPQQRNKITTVDERAFLGLFADLQGARFGDGILLMRSHGDAVRLLHREFCKVFAKRIDVQKQFRRCGTLDAVHKAELDHLATTEFDDFKEYLDQRFADASKATSPRIVFGRLLQLWDEYRNATLNAKANRKPPACVYAGYFGVQGSITQGEGL